MLEGWGRPGTGLGAVGAEGAGGALGAGQGICICNHKHRPSEKLSVEWGRQIAN